MVEQLAGSRVVVLGGTAGIGWETAARFVEEGARVVLLGRDDARGAAACARIRQRIPEADIGFVKADGKDPEQAVQAADAALNLLGGLDVTHPPTSPNLRRSWPAPGQARMTGQVISVNGGISVA